MRCVDNLVVNEAVPNDFQGAPPSKTYFVFPPPERIGTLPTFSALSAPLA